MLDPISILSEAIIDHQNWMIALAAYSEGSSVLSDMQVSSPNDCTLGKWMNSEGAEKFGQHLEFAELRKLHKDLHNLGAEVVKNKHSGDMDIAKKYIKDMWPISRQIVAVIEKLKIAVSGSNTQLTN